MASNPKGKGTDRPIVIVSGGARGLGRAMAFALVQSGARVVVADLPASASEVASLRDAVGALGRQDQLHWVACDISRWVDCENAVQAAVDKFGAVHGLVNNAGMGMQGIGHVLVGKRKRFFEIESDTWHNAINTNLNGAFLMAKAIAPRLVDQGWGRIVNITTSFFTMLLDGFSPYGPSKAALEAATVIWSKDLAGTGVTVNALLPGGPANTRMIPQGEVSDRSTLIQPEVMMAPIVWLMSTRSDGVSGRRIVAKDWDAERLTREPPQTIGSPAGWGDL